MPEPGGAGAVLHRQRRRRRQQGRRARAQRPGRARRRPVRRGRLHPRALLATAASRAASTSRATRSRTRRTTPPAPACSTRARVGRATVARPRRRRASTARSSTTTRTRSARTPIRWSTSASACTARFADWRGVRPQRLRHAVHSAGVPLPELRAVGLHGRDGRAAHGRRERRRPILSTDAQESRRMTQRSDRRTPSIDAASVRRIPTRDGFLVVRAGLLGRRIAELDAEAERLLAAHRPDRHQQHPLPLAEPRRDRRVPLRLLRSGDRPERGLRADALAIRACSTSSATLYGEPACLFKDKLIFKPPGTLGYKLHQDYISWKSFPTSFLTVIVAIDAADAQQRRDRSLSRLSPAGLPVAARRQVPPAARRCGRSVDAASCSTWRRATSRSSAATRRIAPAPNRSAQWRRLLYLSYNALSDGGEQRDAALRRVPRLAAGRYAEYGKTATFFR